MKKKKQFAEFKSELHTISPLTLEIVEARLFELESEFVQIDSFHLDQDHIAMKMIYQDSGFFKTAEITCSLARWEGTHTRLDVNSRAFAYLEWVDFIASMLRILGFAVLIAPFCIVLGTLLAGEQTGVLLGIIASFLGSMLIIQQLAPLDLAKQQRYQAFKVVDKLMQGIADKMTKDLDVARPMLEFDGSDDSLSLLLQQEKFKHFRIGEDGELLR